MIPAIPPIPPINPSAILSGTTPTVNAGASSLSGTEFQNLLGQAIDSINGTTSNATTVSLQAAAGKATAVDATVATTEAELETQLASTLASSTVNALNSIMNMPA